MRILRVARFAARFGFSVAPETLELMREMVRNGEVDHLVAERAWQEISRGLMEAAPSRMFLTLREGGALARILPEVDALFGVPQPPEHHTEWTPGAVMLVVDTLPPEFRCRALAALTTIWARARLHKSCGRSTMATSTRASSWPRSCAIGCVRRTSAATWLCWSRATTATCTAPLSCARERY